MKKCYSTIHVWLHDMDHNIDLNYCRKYAHSWQDSYKIHRIIIKITVLCKSGKTLPVFGCFHFHHFWATHHNSQFLFVYCFFSSKHIQKSRLRIRCGSIIFKWLRNFEHLDSEVSCFSFRTLCTLIIRNWAVICYFWSEKTDDRRVLRKAYFCN